MNPLLEQISVERMADDLWRLVNIESPTGNEREAAFLFAEMLEQAQAAGIELDYVVLATGSGGTQAGLVVGASALCDRLKVLGISVSEEKDSFSRDVLTISRDTVAALGMELEIEDRDIIIFDEYIKEGYGIVDKEIADVLRFVAIQEGVFLDPVYTGKAMVGFKDLIQKGRFKKEDKIVFFHTGGTPAIFPNKHLISGFLNR